MAGEGAVDEGEAAVDEVEDAAVFAEDGAGEEDCLLAHGFEEFVVDAREAGGVRLAAVHLAEAEPLAGEAFDEGVRLRVG